VSAVQIPHGGWFPLALAAGFFFLACLWYWSMTKLLNHVNHMAAQQAKEQSSAEQSEFAGTALTG